MLRFVRARYPSFFVGVFDVLVGPVVDDLGDFFAHCAVFGEDYKAPRLGVSVVRRPGCGFDDGGQIGVGYGSVGEFSSIASCAYGVDDQVRSPV